MDELLNRRQWLAGVGATAGGLLAGSPVSRAASAPTGRVSVGKCMDYGPELVPTLEKMFDELGGLGRLVNGKTVAVKVNFIGPRWYRLGRAKMVDTFWTHPRLIGAVAHLMDKAGAYRIRVVEGPWCSPEPLEELLLAINYNPSDILNAARRVEFEDTNWLGKGKKYSRIKVPGGGYIFDAYDLNHSYEDCDVFVSAAKMKEHVATGVTLSMKNVYGITPVTIYGDGAGIDEPSLLPHGGRFNIFHSGKREPPKSAPQEKNPSATSGRPEGYRLPRIIAELCAARPVDLAIIDGVKTATGGEAAKRFESAANPGVVIAGTNCVATDAVGMAVMGFDPLAGPDAPPFSWAKNCDSMQRMGEDLGLGIRDLKRNEVVGSPIAEVVFDFKAIRKELRRGSPG